jgi:hypothetical protein
MPPLSARQHDAFANTAKMACREGNVGPGLFSAHPLALLPEIGLNGGKGVREVL